MSNELLHEVFEAIQFKGAYGVTERVAIEPYKLPRINVKGVGRLSFPINEYQIEKLKNVMGKPLGSEEKTEEFKKPLYIDKNNIEIDNSFDFLSEIVAIQLGLEGYKIEARLNTLELYEEGGGYHWHQDTKKSKKNFGSLFIHLPSYYEGGELFIKHDKTKIKNIHNQQEGEDGFFYSAYYSDCFHKLETITKGNRIILFYDLILKDIYNTKKPNLSIINVNSEAKNKLNHFIQTIHAESDFDDEDDDDDEDDENDSPIMFENSSNSKDTQGVFSHKNIVVERPRFIFPLDHEYSDSNCTFKGLDGIKLSLLQNMKDENGNDIFFICLGSVRRKYLEDHTWNKKDKLEITSLPHSLLNPATFKIKLARDEIYRIKFNSSYKDFALIWLTDHHFSIVSTWYDFTDDICELVKLNPAYGNKYLDDLITQGNYIQSVKSTLLLRDKNRFLCAIACEPPEDTETFYKIILDSIENEFVTWDEVIPEIARFMGKFDQNQVKLFSNIKDANIKLNFFNEIKKSAQVVAKGLHTWLDIHKEVNCSIDYLFEDFNQRDRASNIELFIYCLDHQVLQKALECAIYICTIFDSILASYHCNFYDEIVLNFIKLNDDQCLRNLIEYLFSPPSNNIVRSGKKYYYFQKIFSIWHSANRTVEYSCKLIPYIINFLEQTPTLDIGQDIYFIIFDIMIASEEGKFLIFPKHFYILLFNRIKFDDFNYQNSIKYLQNCVNKIIKLEDDEYNKSFVIQILGLYYWKDILDGCKLTQSFSNILCDIYLESNNEHSSTTVVAFGCLVISYIDSHRLQNLLLFAGSIDMNTLMIISSTIINYGRANDCNLCSVLANFLIKKEISKKDLLPIFPFLLRIIRNDDIGAKFLHAIDTIIDNNVDLLDKKLDLVENLLFESDLHLESNIFCYSSGFLFRIKSLISFEIDYFKSKKLALSWIYPEDLLQAQVQQHTLRQGIFEFLKQDIQDADFGEGAFKNVIYARKEASVLTKSIPYVQVIASGKANSAFYTIIKNNLFPDPDKTKKKIEQLTTLLAYITSNEDVLNKFGLPTISIRATCADESPMKQTKISNNQ